MHIIGNDNEMSSGKALILNSYGGLEIFNCNPTPNCYGVPGINTLQNLITSNNWSNVIVSVTSGIVTFYVNGILVGNGSGVEVYGINWQIGAKGSLFTQLPFKGKLDDVGIWNRALNQEEISALYAGCQISVATDPTNQTAAAGSNSQFTVSASEVGATYQWQTDLGLGWQNVSNAGQYSGATSDTLHISNVTAANNNQAFRCIITSGSCTDTSETAVLTVLDNSGIEHVADLGVISLFPNPAKDQITLKGSVALIGKKYRIVNQEGKVVVTGILTGEQQLLSLGNFPAGMYTLHIGSVKRQSFKIIKE